MGRKPVTPEQLEERRRAAMSFVDVETIGEALLDLKFTASDKVRTLVDIVRDDEASNGERIAALKELRGMVKDAVALEQQMVQQSLLTPGGSQRAFAVDVRKVVSGMHNSVAGVLPPAEQETNDDRRAASDDSTSQREVSGGGSAGSEHSQSDAGKAGARVPAGSGGGVDASDTCDGIAVGSNDDASRTEGRVVDASGSGDFLEEASRREHIQGGVRKPPQFHKQGVIEGTGIVTGNLDDVLECERKHGRDPFQ